MRQGIVYFILLFTWKATYGPVSAQLNIPMDAVAIQAILDRHNMLREGIQASNMEMMVWNNFMAAKAQAYAEQCTHNANSQRTVGTGYLIVGENLGEKNFTGDVTVATLETFIQDWYDGGVAAHDQNTGMGGGSIFNQVVWDISANIGCGGTRCPLLVNYFSTPVGSNAYHFVCNYAPGGNIHGQSAYDPGVPCTACPAYAPDCFTLCYNATATTDPLPTPPPPPPPQCIIRNDPQNRCQHYCNP